MFDNYTNYIWKLYFFVTSSLWVLTTTHPMIIFKWLPFGTALWGSYVITVIVWLASLWVIWKTEFTTGEKEQIQYDK